VGSVRWRIERSVSSRAENCGSDDWTVDLEKSVNRRVLWWRLARDL
jgi:hypothetical protein